MCASYYPSTSKLYSIQYNNPSHHKIYNAILGRANEPYAFRFLEVIPNSYLLVREKDKLVLCMTEEGTTMCSLHGSFSPLLLQPIQVKSGEYAILTKNQSPQQYLCYDGYVLHSYYIGLKELNTLEEASMWTIKELSPQEIFQKRMFFVLN